MEHKFSMRYIYGLCGVFMLVACSKLVNGKVHITYYVTLYV